MPILPLALFVGALGAPDVDPPPVISGIFPPGITIGTRTIWTVTGANLGAVQTVLSSDPGLKFEPPLIDPSGRSLNVAVRANDYARYGYPEIRVDGPAGVSNLALVRVDSLPQVTEVEPNDQSPAAGQTIPVGTVLAGIIRPLDVDRYRIEGKPGAAVTLDWETRRLGTAIVPVMTITGPNQAAIQQARSLPGGDRDCRTSVVIPPAGWFEVELRDNTFGGDDRARYRLRVDPAPYATGMFPLGGLKGRPMDLALCGGSLLEPLLSQVIPHPAFGGTWLSTYDDFRFRYSSSSPPSPTPRTGSILSGDLPPGRLRVVDDDWPEVIEPADLLPDQPWLITGGSTGVLVNGRLDRPGQVDRFQVEVKAGDRFRAHVEAAVAGSWLDSVVTILGPHGERLGENDDRKPRSPLEPPVTIDGSPSTDSEVDVTIQEDGLITVELADRFGAGGPEYGYRLELGPPRSDFAIHLIRTSNSSDPGPEARSLADLNAPDSLALQSTPGTFGVFNIPARGQTQVWLVIMPRGRPGTLTLDLHHFPTDRSGGIQATKVRLAPAPRPGSPHANEWDAPPLVHVLVLQPDLQPTSFQIEATSEIRAGFSLRREADCIVGVDAAGGLNRPVIRRVTSFPVRVLGKPDFAPRVRGLDGSGRRGGAMDRPF